MPFAFTPTNADQVDVAYGIDHLFSDYIIQDERLSEAVDSITIPDQKGKVAQVKATQRRWSASFTLVGPIDTVPCHAGSTFSWYTPGSSTKMNYFVQTCDLASTYNDTAKWSVTMDCYQGAAYSDETGGGSTPSA